MPKLPFQRGADPGSGAEPAARADAPGQPGRSRLLLVALGGLVLLAAAVLLLPRLLSSATPTAAAGPPPAAAPSSSASPAPSGSASPTGAPSPADVAVVSGRDPFAATAGTALVAASPTASPAAPPAAAPPAPGPSGTGSAAPAPPAAPPAPAPVPPAVQGHTSVGLVSLSAGPSYRATFRVDGGATYTVGLGGGFAGSLTFASVQTDPVGVRYVVVRYAGHSSYDVRAGQTVRF